MRPVASILCIKINDLFLKKDSNLPVITRSLQNLEGGQPFLAIKCKKYLGSNPHTTARVFACLSRCRERRKVLLRRSRWMQLKLYSVHERFFGDKYRSETGLERTHYSFRVGFHREIGALTNSVIPCWKDTRSTWDLRHSIFKVYMAEARHNSIHREVVSTIVTNLHKNTIYIA